MLFIFSEMRLSNGWVATAPYQLSFKNVVLISLCVVSLVVVVFITVVFVIAHCLNTHNIAPHETTAAEALIKSSAVVKECSLEDK